VECGDSARICVFTCIFIKTSVLSCQIRLTRRCLHRVYAMFTCIFVINARFTAFLAFLNSFTMLFDGFTYLKRVLMAKINEYTDGRCINRTSPILSHSWNEARAVRRTWAHSAAFGSFRRPMHALGGVRECSGVSHMTGFGREL